MLIVHIQCLLRVDGSILAGVFLTSFICVVPESASPSHLSFTIPKRQYQKDKNATETSHIKFSEGKQAHVGMEALKTNQTR